MDTKTSSIALPPIRSWGGRYTLNPYGPCQHCTGTVKPLMELRQTTYTYVQGTNFDFWAIQWYLWRQEIRRGLEVARARGRPQTPIEPHRDTSTATCPGFCMKKLKVTFICKAIPKGKSRSACFWRESDREDLATANSNWCHTQVRLVLFLVRHWSTSPKSTRTLQLRKCSELFQFFSIRRESHFSGNVVERDTLDLQEGHLHHGVWLRTDTPTRGILQDPVQSRRADGEITRHRMIYHTTVTNGLHRRTRGKTHHIITNTEGNIHISINTRLISWFKLDSRSSGWYDIPEQLGIC